MSGLLVPRQYGTPSTSYQDDESSLCSSRQGLIRSQRSSTVSSASPEEKITLKEDAENAYRDSSNSRSIRLSPQRLLLFAIALLSLLVLSSLLTVIIYNSTYRNTCTSPSCVSASEALMRNLLTSKKNRHQPSPCEDFYEYACGGWRENTIVRAPLSPEWNVQLETSFLAFDKISKLFSHLSKSRNENITDPQRIALITYQKCMNENLEDAHEAIRTIYEEVGGWLSTAVDQLSVEDMLIGAYRSNAISLLSINAMMNTRDNRFSVLTIEEVIPFVGRIELYQPMESFNAEDLAKGRLDGHWLHTVLFAAGLELAEMLNMKDTPEFREGLAEAILFDYKITRCSTDFYSDPPRELVTSLRELSSFGNLLNFRYFIEHFLGRKLPLNTEIVVGPGENYLRRLVRVLEEYSTPRGRKIIKDYIKFKQLFLTYIHSGKLQTSKTLGGVETLRFLYTGEDDRSLQCISHVAMANTLAFASILDQFWAPTLQENMQQASEIGESLRKEFIEVLKSSHIVDDVDRKALVNKAESVRIRIAIPEAARNERTLQEEAELTANSSLPWSLYFTTIMGNRHWLRISRFGTPIDEGEWPTDTNTFNVNVHYNFQSNSILFPVIWAMEQFLDANKPRFFSFAGFGTIVGHEMSHGFDFRGRNHGPSGIEKNLTICKTAELYDEQLKCYREQYKELGEKRTDDSVLAENVADNTAIRLAYRAWKKRDEMGKKVLPGLEISSDQAFFLSYAQDWCSISRINDGSHSAGKLRVLGPLQNSRAFSDAFSCPAGSFMNPEKKCSLW